MFLTCVWGDCKTLEEFCRVKVTDEEREMGVEEVKEVTE